MIYVSSFLNYKVRTDLENRRIETLWVELKLKSQIISICCYYHSDFNICSPTFITNPIDPIIVSDACQVFDSSTITVDNSISDHNAT